MCVAVWYSGCVLGSGPEVLSSSPTQAMFPSNYPSDFPFSICLPPVYPAVIGYLVFAGVQIQGLFSCNSNGPGGTSGAHTTCCEERPVLPRVPSNGPGGTSGAHTTCCEERPVLLRVPSNGPGGTSGAHTTCCEERPVLLRVPSPAPGALLARLTVPA